MIQRLDAERLGPLILEACGLSLAHQTPVAFEDWPALERRLRASPERPEWLAVTVSDRLGHEAGLILFASVRVRFPGSRWTESRNAELVRQLSLWLNLRRYEEILCSGARLRRALDMAIGNGAANRTAQTIGGP